MKTNPHFFEEWGLDNIFPQDSGLPGNIVILFGNRGIIRYGPSIKISNVRRRANQHDNFSVSISDYPEIIFGCPKEFTADEVSSIYQWVKLNKTKLLEYWDNTSYSTSKFLYELRSL